MGIFKKKEKVMPQNPTKFQKLWYNKRTHAMMVLGVYFVFIAILLLIINIAPKTEKKVPTNNQREQITITDLQTSLINSDYNFTYEITQNGNKTLFKGLSKNNQVEGYKETNTEIIKYEIIDDISYKVLGEDKSEYNIYENVNADYLDLAYIYNLTLPLTSVNIINGEIKTFEYKDVNIKDERKINIVISSKNNLITNINIKDDVNEYNLSFDIIKK